MCLKTSTFRINTVESHLPGESPGEESRRARGGGIRVEAKERKDRLGGRRGSLYL